MKPRIVGFGLLLLFALAAAALAMRGGRPRAGAAEAGSAAPDAPPGMVRVPAGEFWMGSDAPQFQDARPVHRVRVNAFWMDATEVACTCARMCGPSIATSPG